MTGGADRTSEASVQIARIAGVCYLLTIVLGLSAVFSHSHLYSEAALTIGTLAYAVVTVLLYHLFKPVNFSVSLLAAVVSLGGCTLGILESLQLYHAPVQSIVFFGFYCLMLGWLTYRSRFAPMALAPLLGIAGIGWLSYLSPWLTKHLGYAPMVTGLVGEGALTIWLLLGSMNASRRTNPA
jgi:hypothetical protein